MISNSETEKTPALTVGRLSLQAFRNYHEARLDMDTRPVILTGSNGSGKTNLLEAISLFVPGRGLRRAKLSDLQAHGAAMPWGVSMELQTQTGLLKIGTGRDPEGHSVERRLVHIDERPVKSQQLLADHVAMVWVTPEMDRVLTESPSARRRLLDRMVFDTDAAHAGRVTRYEKALRERSRILREGRQDKVWLSALEDEMAKTGVAIAAARAQLLGSLCQTMAEASSLFPRAAMVLQGMVEENLAHSPALLVEDRFRESLAANRQSDAESGACAIGPHRSDLIVTHEIHQKPIALCSTGEQKALVIAVMLAYARLVKHQRGFAPLLLLDDIAAHLDASRREALFMEIEALGVQAWITGTDKAFFQPFLHKTQHFAVERGVVKQA